ncbi:DUF551 domain-containing protein [Pseudomonas aeruginosa]
MSEWIDCSNRMPENSDEVMVWRKWPGWVCFRSRVRPLGI